MHQSVKCFVFEPFVAYTCMTRVSPIENGRNEKNNVLCIAMSVDATFFLSGLSSETLNLSPSSALRKYSSGYSLCRFMGESLTQISCTIQ